MIFVTSFIPICYVYLYQESAGEDLMQAYILSSSPGDISHSIEDYVRSHLFTTVSRTMYSPLQAASNHKTTKPETWKEAFGHRIVI